MGCLWCLGEGIILVSASEFSPRGFEAVRQDGRTKNEEFMAQCRESVSTSATGWNMGKDASSAYSMVHLIATFVTGVLVGILVTLYGMRRGLGSDVAATTKTKDSQELPTSAKENGQLKKPLGAEHLEIEKFPGGQTSKTNNRIVVKDIGEKSDCVSPGADSFDLGEKASENSFGSTARGSNSSKYKGSIVKIQGSVESLEENQAASGIGGALVHQEMCSIKSIDMCSEMVRSLENVADDVAIVDETSKSVTTIQFIGKNMHSEDVLDSQLYTQDIALIGTVLSSEVKASSEDEEMKRILSEIAHQGSMSDKLKALKFLEERRHNVAIEKLEESKVLNQIYHTGMTEKHNDRMADLGDKTHAISKEALQLQKKKTIIKLAERYSKDISKELAGSMWIGLAVMLYLGWIGLSTLGGFGHRFLQCGTLPKKWTVLRLASQISEFFQILCCYAIQLKSILLAIIALLLAPYLLIKTGLFKNDGMYALKLFLALGGVCGGIGYIAVGELGGQAIVWLSFWLFWSSMQVVLSVIAFQLAEYKAAKETQESRDITGAGEASACQKQVVAFRLFLYGGLSIIIPALTGYLPFRLNHKRL